MIKKYNEYIKESLLDKIQGPSKEEIWKNLKLGNTEEEVWKRLGYDYNNINIIEFFNFLKDGVELIPNSSIVYHNFGKNNIIYFKLEKHTKYFYFNPKILDVIKYIYGDIIDDLNEEVDYFIGEKLNSHKLRGNAYISLLRIGKHWIY